MKTCRIHITGAPGSGATTLGATLAGALAIPHHDVDDYYWKPTSTPYREARERADRYRLMEEMFLARSGWVLSGGSLYLWGAPIVPYFDLVVFLRAPTEIRLARIRDREARRFGTAAILPGGWRRQEFEEFLDWASHYDDGSREGRSLAGQEDWLKGLTCPVMRLDGARPTEELSRGIVAAWSQR